MSTSHTPLSRRCGAHGRLKDTSKSETSACMLLCFRSNSQDSRWVLKTLRLHSTVMQFHIFQKFKRWTSDKTYKSPTHYCRALTKTSYRTHHISISKRRSTSSLSENNGYFNGKVIENIRIRKQQKQASCLRLPHQVLRHHFLFLEKACWLFAIIFTYSTSWVEPVLLFSLRS